ncbi:hypothetical protein HUJ04_011427 [Dendroctonus ponderosae]|nr:hypothetical protein HUJ04_011427 [Dendroctonus ponderosae]
MPNQIDQTDFVVFTFGPGVPLGQPLQVEHKHWSHIQPSQVSSTLISKIIYRKFILRHNILKVPFLCTSVDHLTTRTIKEPRRPWDDSSEGTQRGVNCFAAVHSAVQLHRTVRNGRWTHKLPHFGHWLLSSNQALRPLYQHINSPLVVPPSKPQMS